MSKGSLAISYSLSANDGPTSTGSAMRFKRLFSLTLALLAVGFLGMYLGYTIQKPPPAITFVPTCSSAI